MASEVLFGIITYCHFKASTSSSKSSSSASSARSSVTPEVNPFALEMLKQFLVTSSSDPGEVQSILSNPDSLKNFFFKIRSEITAVSAAQEKRGEDNNSNETPSSETDTDKIQSTDDSVPERGRSREKKRNTKRRSSLEKLHDALKEMRFDRMLPLGPRRCTVRRKDWLCKLQTFYKRFCYICKTCNFLIQLYL